MSNDLVLLALEVMCFNLTNSKYAICSYKKAITGPSVDEFLVITKLLLTRYFPYNHKVTTDATAMNLEYNMNHISVCASLPCDRKVFNSRL